MNNHTAALVWVLLAACGFVWIFRGFFFDELLRRGQSMGPPSKFELVLRAIVSLWLVWFGVRGLVTKRLSLLVPGRFDPDNLNRAARMHLHGMALVLMCLAALAGAAAVMLGAIRGDGWRERLGRWEILVRVLSFLAVVSFGLSLSLWLYDRIAR